MKECTIDLVKQFTKDRDWEKFRTPENMTKSINIEAGELLEFFCRAVRIMTSIR